MTGYITRWAHWLDAWLREHLGRPYTAVLGAGLAVSIIASLHTLTEAVVSSETILKIALTVLFELALLVNQLAQLHEHRQARRERRERRRGRDAAG